VAGNYRHLAVYWHHTNGILDTDSYRVVYDTISLQVQKSMPPFTIPQGRTGVYGLYLSTVVWGAELWRWKSDPYSTFVGNVGIRQHRALFTHRDTNYLTVDTIVEVRVLKARTPILRNDPYNDDYHDAYLVPPIGYYRPPTDLEATVGDTIKTVSLSGRWAWLNPAQIVNTAGAILYPAVFTPYDSANWDTAICRLPVRVITYDDRIRTMLSFDNVCNVSGKRYLVVNQDAMNKNCDVCSEEEIRDGLCDEERKIRDINTVADCERNTIHVTFYPHRSIRTIYYKQDTGYRAVTWGEPTSIDVLRADEYHVIFVYEFQNGSRTSDTVYVERRFDFSNIVAQKKGRLLFINTNNQSNNGYEFDTYAWYKTDERGYENNVGDKSYYSESGGDTELDTAVWFRVEMTTKEGGKRGKRIGSCRGKLSNLPVTATLKLRVYPIPATTTIVVENIQWEADHWVKIYDGNSNLVQNYQASSSKETLDVSMLAPGTYYVQNNERSEKIVVR
jgi:hypothetical protein